MTIATLLIRVSNIFFVEKKEFDFLVFLENTSSRSHRDRRPSEKIVANREFVYFLLLNRNFADNFQATIRKRLLAVNRSWRLTAQRGPSEPSAKSTRPMELIGLHKVMMKNEETPLYVFLKYEMR
jgi:hypothetical protein